MSNQSHIEQFAIMRDIAISATEGATAADTAKKALENSSELIGLSAAMLILWDKDNRQTLNVAHWADDKNKGYLTVLEDELFFRLRKDRALVSAYLSFGGEFPYSGFTLPIKMGDEILGAVIGIQPGRGSLVKEDYFLETLAATLSLSIHAARMNELVEQKQLATLEAAAATINHEINNPLQAILGTVQLLSKDGETLDEDILKKLKLVEQSALAIMKVTHRMRNITKVKFATYIDGTKMLDISTDDNST